MAYKIADQHRRWKVIASHQVPDVRTPGEFLGREQVADLFVGAKT